MPKYTCKQWQAVGVDNSWEICLAGGSCGMIVYLPPRAIHPACWRVQMKGQPVQQFYLHEQGGTYQRRRESVLQRAKQWAESQRTYPIRAWERDCWGGWHPEGTMTKAMETALARAKGGEPSIARA